MAPSSSHDADDLRGPTLTAECGSCAGLCCVAPAFAASSDFAVDKPAGRACLNLLADFRCGIHDRLRAEGFRGCTVYDCFGAGQRVTQLTFGGSDWQHHPELASSMFESFAVVRQLHELLWYLDAALRMPLAHPVHDELGVAFDRTDALARSEAEVLLGLDVEAHRSEVNALLSRASELARAGRGLPHADHRGADLVGADLRRTDLRGASLRGALLIGADLRGVDLVLADLTGADLRQADLRGADLRECLFLTQSQLDGAVGDASTLLAPANVRPAHWV